MDDYTPWSKSEFAGARAGRIDPGVGARDCRGCHMPKENGISSHRWLGGHSYLAAMQHDPTLVEQYQRFLAGVASVDIAPGATPKGFDVVIRNLAVGHRFPGGVMDAQDTRLEVTITDASGRVLARDDSHALRSEVLDKEGQPLKVRQTHKFVTAVWNRTLEPRGVQAVRYRLDAPSATKVSVRLL